MVNLLLKVEGTKHYLMKEENKKWEKRDIWNKIWSKNGLNNLTYSLLNKTKLNKNINQIKVDLKKSYDIFAEVQLSSNKQSLRYSPLNSVINFL